MSEELSDSLTLYFKPIRTFPLLTHEEEIQLGKALESGGEEERAARDKLVESNQRLVVSITKKFQGLGIPLEDLISSGNEGLIRGVDKFDYRLGNRFSTLATWWVNQAVSRAVSNQGRTVRLPVHVVDWLSQLKKASQKLSQELGREPLSEEVAAELNFTVKKVKMLQRVTQTPLSLEMPIGGEDNDILLGDLIEDMAAPDSLNFVTQGSLQEQMQDVLGSLGKREREVLELRFGLVDGESRTLEEVGNMFGVSRERIRQIEAKALRKLRHPIRVRRLGDFHEGPISRSILQEEGNGKMYQDPNWLKQKYCVEKLTAREMGELASCEKATIYLYMKLHGIPTRSHSEARFLAHQVRGNGRNYRDESWLYQRYVEEGASCYEIATEENVDPSTVLNWLKKSNISRRTLSEAQFLRKVIERLKRS